MTGESDDGRFYWQANMEDDDGNVTACVTPEELNNPDFYGVYERLEDGTATCLADFWTQVDAELCRDAVALVYERHAAPAKAV